MRWREHVGFRSSTTGSAIIKCRWIRPVQRRKPSLPASVLSSSKSCRSDSPGPKLGWWTRTWPELTWKFTWYLDYTIVFSFEVPENVNELRTVFERLSDALLKLKPSKCKMFQRLLPFLGHVISEDGIVTDPAKVASVVDVLITHQLKAVHRQVSDIWDMFWLWRICVGSDMSWFFLRPHLYG